MEIGLATGVAEGVAGTKPVGFWEAFWFWVKLGFINFGGPAGQIAIMHRELVDEKRWVSEGQYLRTLNFCMLLPGPEAQQVAPDTGRGPTGGAARGGAGERLLFMGGVLLKDSDLLQAPSGTRGPAGGDVHRVEAARDVGRHR